MVYRLVIYTILLLSLISLAFADNNNIFTNTLSEKAIPIEIQSDEPLNTNIIISNIPDSHFIFPIENLDNIEFNKRPSPDYYWKILNKISKKIFSGLDLGLTFSPRYSFNGDNIGTSVGMSWDIYSTKDKLARRKLASDFLQEGAKIIKELEYSILCVDLLKRNLKIINLKSREEGIAAILEGIKIEKDIAKERCNITQYHRELQSMINPFKNKTIINGTFEPINKKKD